ncbi:MAG: hypothetical protein QM278_08985 [Pseudomonadota bacterium]|nr:hypothetical protein [Pseudomonadota bacterium]
MSNMQQPKSYDIDLLLERKLKACRHFLATTRELKNALAAEEMSEALHLIQDREKLIHVIEVLDNLMNPEALSSRMGQREDLFREMRLVLDRMAKENLACEELSTNRCLNLKDEFSRLRQQGQVIKEYAARDSRPPQFLSLKS